MSQKERKQNRINQTIEDAAKALEAEGVKFFIGVLDHQPKEPNGGNAYVRSDVSGDDFFYMLKMAMNTREDVTALGVQVGKLLLDFNKRKP